MGWHHTMTHQRRTMNVISKIGGHWFTDHHYSSADCINSSTMPFVYVVLLPFDSWSAQISTQQPLIIVGLETNKCYFSLWLTKRNSKVKQNDQLSKYCFVFVAIAIRYSKVWSVRWVGRETAFYKSTYLYDSFIFLITQQQMYEEKGEVENWKMNQWKVSYNLARRCSMDLDFYT